VLDQKVKQLKVEQAQTCNRTITTIRSAKA